MQPLTSFLPTGDAQTLQALFDALPGNVMLVKADGPAYTVLAATPAYLRLTGHTRASLIGKGTFEAFPANYAEAADTGAKDLRTSYGHVLTQKETHLLPVQRYDLKAENGSYSEHYWRASNSPVFGPAGEVAYILHSAEDITHEIKAKAQAEKIKGLEQAYGLFMQAPFAIHIFTGPDLVVDLANPPTLELWGKTENVTGKRFLEVLPEMKGQGYDVLMQEVMQTGIPRFFYEVPLLLNRPGKEPVGYFNFIYQPYYKEGVAAAESVLIIANEVTQQVLARKQASETGQSLGLAVEIAQLGVFNIDLKTGIATYSQQVADWFGFAQPTLPLSEILTNVYPDDQPVVAETLERSMAGEWDGRHDFVYRVLHPATGAVQYLRSIGQVLYEDGAPLRLSGIIQDTTEQVTAQKKLEESEARFRNVIEQAPVAIGLTRGTDMVFESINPSMLQIINKKSKDEVLGKRISAILPELEDQPVKAVWMNVLKTGESFQASEMPVGRLVDGVLKGGYFNLSYTRIVDAKGVAFLLHMAVEVTEQVRARQKMEQNEKQLETALEQVRLSKEAAELGTFDLDLEQVTLHWDDRCRTLFGISHHQPVTYEKDFVGGLHPDDKDRVLEVIRKSFIQSIGNGDYDVEYRTVGAEDGLVRWVRAKGKVYFNGEAVPVRFIGSVLDITEQVNALQKTEGLVKERTRELAEANNTLIATNAELQRSNANLEEFAHAASHDLKEPIRKITFFTHQLKDQLTAHLQEAELRSFNRIENATERMGALIDDLLLYSHVSQRPHETEAVDLNQKVNRVMEDLELDIQEKGAVINVGKLPVVKGYRRQLQQLFQNLLSNALKYSKAGVPPVIDISAAAVTENNKAYHAVSVADNGIGFDPQYADKVFQMFARLHGKSEYGGTGVGLSIVKKVVENHNGFIRVESAPGEGSTFIALLPVE